MLWLVLTILIAAAALIVVGPFLRRSDTRGDAVTGVEVYKDQLAEVERDKEQGMIDDKEADLARLEIERRILAANRGEAPVDAMAPAWQFRIAIAAVIIVVLGAVGLYAVIGQPNIMLAQNSRQVAAAGPAGAMPAQHPGTEQGAGQNGDGVGSLVTRLEQRLKTDPNDADGWRVLGWSYYNTGRYQDAVTAYKRGVDLQKDNASMRALYGEALVMAANGIVTPDAVSTFDAVLAIDPKDERARFFKGVAKAQKGDNQGALDEWISLYNTAPAGAEWAQDLRGRIDELAQSSGIDVSSRLTAPKTATAAVEPGPASAPPASAPAPAATPGPSAADVESAKQLKPEDRQQMVQTMVERLAAKLKEMPQDADGWIMLIRSRMVLNQPDEARAALEQAKKVFADAPESNTRITQAAEAMGVQPTAR